MLTSQESINYRFQIKKSKILRYKNQIFSLLNSKIEID